MGTGFSGFVVDISGAFIALHVVKNCGLKLLLDYILSASMLCVFGFLGVGAVCVLNWALW